jgi:hypothetical protein
MKTIERRTGASNAGTRRYENYTGGTMRQHRLVMLIAIAGASLTAPALSGAQQPGGMKGMSGMMGKSHDSATMALMMGSHELVMNHDRIKRTVTNLPNGVRTVTESDDAHVAALIKEHVAISVQRVQKGDDPQLPMETPALHSLFTNNDKIHTTREVTAKGVVVVQTSDDSSTVAALQKHASEVSELVVGGMAAMHASMMKNSGHQMGPVPGHDTTGHPMSGHHMVGHQMGDSAFAAMQQRGKSAMGVDQYTSTHHFEALPDGGRIELQRDVDDSAGVAQIRTHLQEIAKAFGAGDFNTPAFVHMQDVPGTKVMAAKRTAITYTFRELPRGGQVRIQTNDAEAVAAIHEFLAFQRKDHRAP